MGGTIGRVGAGIATGGLSEFAQKNPFGTPLPFKNPIRSGIQGVLGLGGDSSNNPYISGPFSLDPNQVAADQAAIKAQGQQAYQQANSLAQQQYDQTMKQLPGLVSNQLALDNPNIMESLNATHQLNSTAYPTELARQQALLTNQISIPALQQLQQGQSGALQGLEGYQSGALQRGLSLEDQINNANISKSIGQIFAPQPPSGKAQFGTAAQGIGAIGMPLALGKAGGAGRAAAPAGAPAYAAIA